MIKEIQIERFKGLRKTPKLNIGKVNLLTGTNGRGKSSLCQVLLMLAQTWDVEAMNALLPKGKWVQLGSYSDIHYTYSEDKSIVFHIVTDDKVDNDFRLEYSNSETKPTLIEINDVKVGGKSIFDKSGNSMGDFSSDFSGDFDVRLSRLSDYPPLMALRRLHYVAANRIAVQYHETLDESTNGLKPDGSNVLSVLWNNRNKSIIKDVEEMMDFILDGAEFHIESSVNELVFTINSAKSAADNKLFQPVNVGYGHGYILSILTSLAISSEGDILIVENPEAHLHPAAQAKLMNTIIRFANKKNLQVFVETHSDHILNTSLLALKNEDLRNENGDLQVLFFSGRIAEDGHFEATPQNLELTSEGHILNPPDQFFEQYAIDLENLYL